MEKTQSFLAQNSLINFLEDIWCVGLAMNKLIPVYALMELQPLALNLVLQVQLHDPQVSSPLEVCLMM